MHLRLTIRRIALEAIAIAIISAPSFAQDPVSANKLHQADTIYRAGTAALAQQDLATAQSDFEQVIRLIPSAEPAHVALGLVLVHRGHLQEGIHEYQVALTLRKTDPTAQLNLAIAYQQIGQPAKAIPLFTQIEAEARINKKPLSASILSAYARALAATGNLSQAALKMRAALSADPRNAQLHDDLGSIDAQQTSWDSARQEFSAAIQIDPQLAAAHLHLGLALQALNQPGSLNQLQQARTLAPDNPVIALELGKAYVAASNDDQAIPLFQQVLDQNPHSIDAMSQLALAYQRSNRSQDAIGLFRKVLDADPANAIAAADLGMALTQAQRAKDGDGVLGADRKSVV